MRRVAAAIETLPAGFAISASRCPILPKFPEAMVPNLRKTIGGNIALHQLGTALNVQAGINIAIAQDACNVDARSANEIIVPHFPFVGGSEIVGAAVADVQLPASGIVSLLTDKIQ